MPISKKKKKKSTNSREHPGGPVVRILGFHCHDLSSIPDQGTEIPQAMWCSQKQNKKSLQTINAGEGVEKGEPSSTDGGNENQYSHYEEQYRGSLKH